MATEPVIAAMFGLDVNNRIGAAKIKTATGEHTISVAAADLGGLAAILNERAAFYDPDTNHIWSGPSRLP